MSRFKRHDNETPLARTRACDVCGRQRPVNGFGDGMKLSKGTCIACGEQIKTETERRKIELQKMSKSK